MVTSDFLSSSESTGTLPLTTTNGFNYILVSVIENYTHPILVKSRTQGAYTAAFTVLYSFYKSKGKRPKYQCRKRRCSQNTFDDSIKLYLAAVSMFSSREISIQEIGWYLIGYPIVFGTKKLDDLNIMQPSMRTRRLKSAAEFSLLPDNSIFVY